MFAAACIGFSAGSRAADNTPPPPAADQRPNIVLIFAEDISPDVGCYGNQIVHTPNLDRLASQGARFDRNFTHAPVCAPSRSGLITGMYPTSIGTHHMRSKLAHPPAMFTDDLKQAGYHVRWAGKTDFNFNVPDGSFATGAWDNGQSLKVMPQPFLAYINFNTTHESRSITPSLYTSDTKTLTDAERVDPATVTVPAFYPDTPEVRQTLAHYFDTITALDKQVGQVLDLLDRTGLSQNTVVVFWGDHGRGLPRHKRWVYDSGTRCPLLVRWPGRIAPGSVRDDLAAVVDFAPTLLTVAGVPVPQRMQGQSFLTADGQPNPSRRRYVYAARDRMDNTFDRIRAVRDERFLYIRNYHPELPYAQIIEYQEPIPIMKVWRQLAEQRKLEGAPALFFAATKPPEELYDTAADPDQVNNLAGSDDPQIQSKLRELSQEMDRWQKQYGDMGEIPEEELLAKGILLPGKPKPNAKPASKPATAPGTAAKTTS